MTGASEARGETQRRRHKRYGQKGEILLRRVASGPTYEADLFDISCEGCLVWLTRPVPFAVANVVELLLATGGLSFRVTGTIRHSGENGRVAGIEFQRLGANQSNALRRFIMDLQSAGSRDCCSVP